MRPTGDPGLLSRPGLPGPNLGSEAASPSGSGKGGGDNEQPEKGKGKKGKGKGRGRKGDGGKPTNETTETELPKVKTAKQEAKQVPRHNIHWLHYVIRRAFKCL